VVIPFNQCIARPAEGARPPQLLVDHLTQVAERWENTGKSCRGGKRVEARVYQEILRLGGFMHDAGKARTSWQDYIASTIKSRRGRVFHSPAGAVLFFYSSKKLVTACVESGLVTQNQARSTEMSVLRAGITLDIAGHHGELKDVEEIPPWEGGFSLEHLDEMDLEGLFAFAVSRVSVAEIELTRQEALAYITEKASDEWHKLSLVTFPRLRREILRAPARYSEAARRCLKLRTSGLIVADRLDAAGVEESCLCPEAARAAIDRVTDYLERKSSSALRAGAAQNLVNMRKSAQQYAVSTYLKHPGEGIYRLNLPTGLGKTMASLRVALFACAKGFAERIIYVAPYISILSQATEEIRAATGLEVIQHHHLSVLDSLNETEGSKKQSHAVRSAASPDLPDRAEDAYLLTMESWQSPVVTTTFNQFFLALFPRRAQQTLRMGALQKAFIIIDEAQIIDVSAWKLFLRMTESLVTETGCQVLFITATMPPVENGLSKAPFSLTDKSVYVRPRYEIVREPEVFDSHRLVDEVICSLDEVKHVAVVVNTVKNASRVFSLLQERLSGVGAFEGVRLYHLSGAMTPLHKSYIIDTIRRDLGFRGSVGGNVKNTIHNCNKRICPPGDLPCKRTDEKFGGDLTSVSDESSRSVPVVVVSTQVLEAGVDLSFDCIFRELPVMPSIVQVAGRANRHGEKTFPSQVRVFRFLDENGKEPRVYVYRSPVWREETDRILDDSGGWSEDESSGLLEAFFEECYRRVPGEAFLDWLVNGAVGDGSALRNIVPFEEQSKPIDVFVPLDDWITPSIKGVMNSFETATADDIYNRYLEPGFIANMPFIRRKRFFALMQHFTVSVDWSKAMRIADRHSDTSLWRLINSDYYDRRTGLADTGMSDFSHYVL
jgi:CRISPR-associated endonuclease/helicase Cas3